MENLPENYECDGQMSIFDFVKKQYFAFNLLTHEQIEVTPDGTGYTGNRVHLEPCGMDIEREHTENYYLISGKFYERKEKTHE